MALVALSVALPSEPPIVAVKETIAQPAPRGHSGVSPCDPRRYRAIYPDLWHTFLRAHFRDHVHVAFFFSVSERAARDWWEGVTASQGWAVAYAIEEIPTAAAYLRAA